MAQLRCLDCPSLTYQSLEELEAHIASDHLAFCPYECEKCRYAKFPTEFALISHYKDDHGLSEFSIRYRYNEEVRVKKLQLKAKLDQCMNNDTWINSTIKEEGTNLPAVHQIYPSFIPETSEKNNYVMKPTDNKSYNRYSPIDATTPKCGQIACELCGDKISNQRSSRVYHANTRHGKYEMYECTTCGRTWYTIAKSDVVKHVKTHHLNPDGTFDLSIINDNRKKLAQELRDLTRRCFPNHHQQRQTPLCHGNIPENKNYSREDDLDDDSDMDESNSAISR